ncbi:uncharacterized protein LOC113147146 [Cyclospora cayetanensis]|uniref:Uncharacterized protein LOC113147146 n=1 Tax=Cyclospora cayetanensis TaxID=88456 RepID=A0A6P6RYG6_9EIME|nr:uncharacterized protein LOC113147146 [Cyclospora cayetanensis]
MSVEPPRRLLPMLLLLLPLLLLLIGSSVGNNSSSSSTSTGIVFTATAQELRGSSTLAAVGAPPRRLQAGVSVNEQDKAQKGFIIIWMSITLVFVVILGIWITVKIADVTDPLLHTKFVSAR